IWSRIGKMLERADVPLRTVEFFWIEVGAVVLAFVLGTIIGVGVPLASLFDMVADTVRQRQQFARKIRALTAMGRMSAYTLIAVPFFIAGAVTVLNPSYMRPLYFTTAGHFLCGLGLVMMGLGS